MAVNPINLVMGPATFYVGAFGTTEPTDANVATAPGSGWTDVGGTDGGVIFEIDGTYTDLNVDQIVMAVGSRLTELKPMVTATLSEITLTNLNQALNNIGTTGSGTGYSSLDINAGSSATQPSYSALIIDGWAPANASTGASERRRVIVRKVLSQPKVKLAYDKKTQQGLETSFGVYYVSSTLAAVHIVDATS